MTTAPICEQDFFGPEALSDPVPMYHQLLEVGPVCYLPRNRLYAISRFSELTEALRKPLLFQSGRGVSVDDEVNKRLIGSTLNSDPPEHDRTRAITGAPLTPKGLAEVKDRIVQTAEELAERLVARGHFDAAAELAPHLPLTVVRDLVGLGPDASERMLDWAAATFELMGDARERRDQALKGLGEMRAFLETHSTAEVLTPGGWARRIFELGPEAGLSQDRCAELMRDYINPSLDTTIAAIGFGIKLFADNPDQWQRLRADPTLMKNAVEEIVRLATPIKAFSRYVAEETEVAGVALPQGARVLMVWGAGNRDSRQFDDPDRFDIARANARRHVGFGHGVHACMGMHLARLEMTALFEALLQRVARFHANGAAVPGINATIRAYRNVPVAVDRL